MTTRFNPEPDDARDEHRRRLDIRRIAQPRDRFVDDVHGEPGHEQDVQRDDQHFDAGVTVGSAQVRRAA